MYGDCGGGDCTGDCGGDDCIVEYVSDGSCTGDCGMLSPRTDAEYAPVNSLTSDERRVLSATGGILKIHLSQV